MTYIAIVMAGELTAFILAAGVIRRPRPSVAHLDSQAPPTSSYPSGHTAAAVCLYVAIAIAIIGHARGWWRWLSLIPAIALPALVGASRLYRGEHHPTDLAGSLLLAAVWLAAVTLVVRPFRDARPGLSQASSSLLSSARVNT